MTQPNDERSDVKLERFEETCRVELSQDEIAERAQRAAHLLQKRDDRDADSKAAQKAAKAEIERIEAEMRAMSAEVRDKATYKPVPCERQYIYRTGVVREIRTDTGEVLRERPMSDRERQTELPIDEKPKGELN